LGSHLDSIAAAINHPSNEIDGMSSSGHESRNPDSPSRCQYYHKERSPTNPNEPFRDIPIPPLPTIVMPTSGLSSPMTTPLQSPAQFDQFPDNLQLRDDEEYDSERDYEDDRLRIQASQYPRLLEQQIKRQAQEARYKRNTQFARLYSIAQMPKMKKKIQLILSKKDIPQSQKVDCIASLLRMHQDDS